MTKKKKQEEVKILKPEEMNSEQVFEMFFDTMDDVMEEGLASPELEKAIHKPHGVISLLCTVIDSMQMYGIPQTKIFNAIFTKLNSLIEKQQEEDLNEKA